ncbi:MAG: family 78 glycoside hydrolase catalytic domain [Lachnospiraceae bacterium]
MKITNVRINGIKNPIGYHFDDWICSWKVKDASGKKQENAVIELSREEDFSSVFLKLEGRDLLSTGVDLGIKPEPRSRYFYRISVTDENGETAVSAIHFFETGKMKETWEADWITMDEQDNYHPIFEKLFTAGDKIARARMYMTGVGLFEVRVNGSKISEEYLKPYLNNYEHSIQALTFDLTSFLQAENRIQITLGKGWYMGTFGLELQSNIYGSRMAMISEIHIEYENGDKQLICSDGSWHYYGSDIEDSGIYLGEIYNRLLWSEQDNPRKPVVVVTEESRTEETRNLKKEVLTDRVSIPIFRKEILTVKEVILTPAGETVLDFGQNFAGIIQFDSDLPKGTKVVFDFGEILQEGNFYNKNYRDAISQFVFTSNGEKERVEPHFTFFGFRYVRVTGWNGEIAAENFKGIVLYSDLDRTGYLTTGNKKVNRLYENTVWGLKSNFLDMPTDCPQRSERLGWTGDAQVFAPTACYHMDTRAFFHKFIQDLREEQLILDGGVPNYLPNIGHKTDCSSVWGDIATFLPDTLYRFYGNTTEVRRNYAFMKDWVDYIDRQDAERCVREGTAQKGQPKKYLFDFGFTFGDWLALDGPLPTSFKGSTDDSYISSMYYFRSAQIVSQMSELLGYEDEAKYYKELSAKIRSAVLYEYFTPSGRLAVNTQAAFVIALKFGVYYDKEKTISQFKKRLEMDCNQIKCGFVGAPMLCTVLAECGLFELAYDFLLKEGFPSWLYSVNLGATTIWERWNSVLADGTISDTGMNSLNHYAYGSVMEFVYGYCAGIRPLTPGFKKAVIAPNPDIRLGKLECTYDSAAGSYVSNWWIREDGMLTVHIEIPFDATAQLTLPGAEIKELAAGVYDFEYMPTTDFTRPFHEFTTLSRLSQNEEVMRILFQFVPPIGGIAASGDLEMGAKSLKELSFMSFLGFDPGKLDEAIEEIKKVRA